MLTSKQRWYAELLYAGLETGVLTEDDVLKHVTPGVLSSALPKDILVRVFDAALASGTMSPKAIISTVTPELMSEYADSVVWDCLETAALRTKLVDGTDALGPREFLRRGIASGLVTTAMTPKAIVEFVNAKIIGVCFPDDLTAKLLDASLACGKMTPELVVEELGVDAIAKYPPTSVLWNLFETISSSAPIATGFAAGSAATEAKPAKIPAPAPQKATLEFVDDDMPSVTVSIDDPVTAALPVAKA